MLACLAQLKIQALITADLVTFPMFFLRLRRHLLGLVEFGALPQVAPCKAKDRGMPSRGHGAARIMGL